MTRCSPVPVLALVARTVHWASIAAEPPGHRSHLRCSRHWGAQVAPGGSPAASASRQEAAGKGTGCAGLPVRIGLRAKAGMRTRTSAHLPGFGVRGCAGLPVRIGLRAKAGMRTRTSAHLPRARRLGVRGPPGPHRASRQGRNADEDVRAPPRVRRLGCADLPVRMGFAPRPGCGRGRPRTSPGSASGGARASRPALACRSGTRRAPRLYGEAIPARVAQMAFSVSTAALRRLLPALIWSPSSRCWSDSGSYAGQAGKPSTLGSPVAANCTQ